MSFTRLVQIVRELRDPENYFFNLHAAPPLFTFFAVLSLGLFVVIHERHSAVRGSFFLLTATIGFWLGAFGLMYAAADPATACRWAKIGYLAMPFIPASTYYFTRKVLRLGGHARRNAWVFFGVSAVFSAILVATPWMFSGLSRYPWGYYPRYSLWSLIYLSYFFALMGVSLRHYVAEDRKTQSKTHRLRIRWLLVALCISCLAGADYLAKFGIPLYPFGYACILVFTLIAVFVVTLYRLVDITPSFAASTIIGAMGDGLLVLDSEEVIRVANDVTAELFEVSKENMIGTPLSSLSPVFPEKNSPDLLHRVGTDHTYEMAHETPSGKILILGVSESSMKDEKGCVIATVLVLKDLTKIKLTETALKETENRLTELYHESPDALIVLDEFGRFVSANPAAQKLLGFSGEKLEGKIFVMSRFLPSQCISKVLKVMRSIIQGQAEGVFDLELIREDGVSVKVAASPSPIRKNGKISEIQFILRTSFGETESLEKALEKERAEIRHNLRTKLEEMFKDDVYLMRKLEKLKF